MTTMAGEQLTLERLRDQLRELNKGAALVDQALEGERSEDPDELYTANCVPYLAWFRAHGIHLSVDKANRWWITRKEMKRLGFDDQPLRTLMNPGH